MPWCTEHASEATLGGRASRIGPTVVACRTHRTSHEVDLVVLEERPRLHERIAAIGEAKWRRSRPMHLGDLERLEHVREVLGCSTEVKLLVFAGGGFDVDLRRGVQGRRDVELIDLDRLDAGD